MISQKFPNLDMFLKTLTEPLGGGFVSDDNTKLSYKFPVLTFGNHVGDNWIILEKMQTDYRLTLESKTGRKIKIKTYSKSVYFRDLKSENWDEELNDLIQSHWTKEEYREFSAGMSAEKFMRGSKPNNSGCMLLITLCMISLITILFI